MKSTKYTFKLFLFIKEIICQINLEISDFFAGLSRSWKKEDFLPSSVSTTTPTRLIAELALFSTLQAIRPNDHQTQKSI